MRNHAKKNENEKVYELRRIFKKCSDKAGPLRTHNCSNCFSFFHFFFPLLPDFFQSRVNPTQPISLLVLLELAAFVFQAKEKTKNGNRARKSAACLCVSLSLSLCLIEEKGDELVANFL